MFAHKAALLCQGVTLPIQSLFPDGQGPNMHLVTTGKNGNTVLTTLLQQLENTPVNNHPDVPQADPTFLEVSEKYKNNERKRLAKTRLLAARDGQPIKARRLTRAGSAADPPPAAGGGGAGVGEHAAPPAAAAGGGAGNEGEVPPLLEEIEPDP